MKKVYALLLIAAFAFVANVQAQTIANYAGANFSFNQTGSLDAMSGATSLAGSGSIAVGYNDDNASGVVNIGFPFYFMGVPYTQFSVNSNGQMRLGATATAATYTSFTATTAVLAPMAGDNSTGFSATQSGTVADADPISYVVTGTAPNRILKVQWKNFQVSFSSTGTVAGNMQAWLYETSGKIVYVYGSMYNVSASAAPRSIFIQSSSTATTAGYVTVGTTPTFTAAAATVTNSFAAASNIANLYSASNGSRWVYTWTPGNAPTAAPGTPTFSGVTGSAMNVNWADNSSNELGFAVYRSTDNVNFTLAGTVAANAVTYAASGLSFGTTYYWKVEAFTEGQASSSGTGTQATPAASFTGTGGVITVGTGGDYNNLTTAFAAINAAGLANDLDIRLITGYPAAAETYPIVTSTAASVGSFRINVYPTVSGLSITSANATGTINMNNGTNIRWDGRVNATGSTKDLIIANTNVGASYAIQFTNDASNNTIRYCTIKSVNNSTTSGTIVFGTSATGSTGNDGNLIDNCDILDGASTPLNAIYSAGTSTALDNSGNSVTNCNIANYFGAASASKGISLASNSSAWTITGNKFYQGSTRTATSGNNHFAISIVTASGGGYNISNNTIGYANNSGSGTTTYAGAFTNRFVAIDITASNSPVSTVQGNTITNISVTSTSGGATAIPVFGGITIQAGSINVGTTSGNLIGAATGNGAIVVSSTTAPIVTGIYATSSGTVVIQNNNIGSINASGTTTVGATVSGIQTAGSGIFTISTNNIGSSSTTNSIAAGTSGTTTATTSLYGIQNSASGTPLNITNNNVYNLRQYSSGTSSLLYNIYNTGSATTVNITGNTVNANTNNAGALYGIYNSGAGSGTYNLSSNNVYSNINGGIATSYGMYGGGPTTLTMSSNNIYSNSMTGASGTFYCMAAATTQYTVNSNQIYSNSFTANSGASASVLYGFYDLSSPTVENFTNNQIYNLSIAGASTATTNILAGIYTFTTTGTKTWSDNSIYSLAFTNSSTGTCGVYGIRTASSTPSIFKNKIYDLSAQGATSFVYGISVESGTNPLVYNNLVGDLRAPAGSNGTTDVIRGISITSTATTSTNNIVYNSIYLNASGGTNFTTSGIFHTYSGTATTSALVLLNNNIVNNSTPSGTGLTIGVRRSASTDLLNYSTTSNTNNIYCGTPGASRLIYYDGTNADQTLGAFKTRMSTREQGSISENPTYVSTAGANANFLHINTTVATQLESGGTNTALVTSDYDGQSRAITPDIGADEFTGVPADFTAPGISYTALAGTCAAGARSFSVSVTDASGVPTSGAGLPVCYWKINAGSYNATQATFSGGSNYTFSIGTGSVAGDVISYYVVAQDNATIPNVGSNPGGGAGSFTNTPPAAGTPPTTPNTYTIQNTLSGTKNIPGDYATLTLAVAAYNSNCVSGNVVFQLASGYSSAGETFPIVINANPGSSVSNTLTIKPASGTTQTISGALASGALIKLNGASYVTIDGSNSGGTDRSLTITNTSTTTPTAVQLASLGTGLGSTNDIVKNCNISVGVTTGSTYGIAIGGSTPGTTGADNDNNTLQNNLITIANVGIYAGGTASVSTGGMDNLTLTANDITVNNTTSPAIGIQLSNSLNSTVTQNIVDVKTTASTAPVGISLETGFVSSSITRNKIKQVATTATGGYGGRGITIGTGTATSNLTIANNQIFNVTGSNWPTFDNSSSITIGIGIIGNATTLTTTAGGINLYYNSLNIAGSAYGTQTGTNTAALYVGTGASALDIRNNNFVNSSVATGTGSTNYGIYSAAPATAFTTINYNNYFGVTSANSAFAVAYLGSAQTTIAAWRTALGGSKEANGIAVDPLYNNALDLRPQLGSPIISQGTPVSITNDYINNPRSVTTPSIGAFELAADVNPPTITFTALGTTCSTGDRTFTAVITDISGVDATATYKPRIYFKKGAGSYFSAQGVNTGGNNWDFTISAATLGGLAVSDVITYYVVAQDLAIPFNVGASTPSTGFAATDVNTITTPPTTPNTYVIGNLLNAGTYTVGAAGNYATLTAAVAAYNTSCLGGNIIFSLIDASYSGSETFPITIGTNPDAGPAAQLTIMPATGVTPTITGSNASAIIKLNGADYVTIAGSLVSTTTRDLTITNSNTTASSSAILISSLGTALGATNNTIRNVNIGTGTSSAITYGISVGGATAGTAGADNDNISILNNSISGPSTGIYAIGTVAGVNDNLAISNNTIASNTSVVPYGIEVGYGTGGTITLNTLDILTSSSTQPVGISMETGYINASVTKNIITQVNTTSTGGYGGRGLTVGTGSATSNITIANNMIYGVNGSNYSGFTNSSTMGIGIGVVGSGSLTDATGGVKLYYNSVSLKGTHSYGTGTITAALYIGSAATALDIRNNIFVDSLVNTNASGTGSKDYGIYSAAPNTAFTLIDYNDYYGVTTGNSAFLVGYLGGDQATIAAWRTASGQGANSLSARPQFISATNLRINPAVPTQIESAGTPIAAVTTDFEGDARNATTPDIGADEGNFIALTCFPPSSPLGSALTSSTASLSWTAANPAPSNGYVWEVRSFGAGGSGAVGLAASGSTAAGVVTATATGLTANTIYTVYVRSFCGGTDYSFGWVASATFSTPCSSVAPPYLLDFNASISLPSCTGVINSGSGNVWSVYATTPTGYTGNVLYYPYNSTSAANTWFFTRGLTLKAGLTYQLSYLYGASSASFPEDMKVAMGVSPSAAAMTTTLVDHTNITTSPNANTLTFTVPSDGDYYIGFQAHSIADQFNIYLDDIDVEVFCQSPTTQPTALTFPSTGPTTINGAFTAAAGSPDGYMVVRYAAGATATAPTQNTDYNVGDALGTGTVISVSSITTFSATGLTPLTGYDFYIYALNANCLGGTKYNLTSPLFGTSTTASCAGPVNTALFIGPGGDYPNLTTLIPFLTSCGVSGPTVAELQSNYDPSTESYPITITSIPGASATNTVTIRPSAASPGFALSGTTSIATNPLLDLSGVKYLILDGRPGGNGLTHGVSITNTGTGPALRLFNDAQNNIVRYVDFKSSNTASNNGVIRITSAGSAGTGQGNNNNTIDHCGINANGVSPNGIYCAGSGAPSDNKSNIISNNDIYDFYSNTAGMNNVGIYLAGNNGVSTGGAWTISGNSFYQTSLRVFNNLTGTNYVAAIAGDILPLGTYSITGNYVGGTAANAGGTAWTASGATSTYAMRPIYIFAGSTATTTISGNTIANINLTTGNSGFPFNGITANSGQVNVTSNTIGSASTPGSISITASGGTSNGIQTANGSAQIGTSINVTSNTIAGITLTGTTGHSFAGVSATSAATLSGASSIASNIIGTSAAGIANTVSGAVTASVTGITQGNAATFTITGNAITNLTTTATGSGTTMRGIVATGGTNTIGASGSGKNTMNNISSPALNTSTGTSASLIGILNTSALTAQVIDNNEISALRATATGASSITVTGIAVGSGATTGTITRSKIWDLTNTSTGTAGFIIGYQPTATTGTWTFANNMVSLTNGSNTNNMQLNGVYDVAAGGTRNYYFNSIYIGGNAAGALNSVSLQRTYSATATTINVLNNILVNARTGGGSNYAIANLSASATTGWTSNNNVLNAPNSAKIGVWGTVGTGDKTFATWKTTAVGDNLSFSGLSVPFVNTATGDLHLNFGATATAIESGGAIGTTAITTDFDNDARPGPTGSTRGGASAADIGADEIDAAPLAINVGATGVATPSGSCLTATQTVAINVKNFGSAPLNYAITPVTVTGTVVSPSAASTPFTVVLSSGTLAAGATVAVTVLTNYDMSAAGNYVINANATVSGDLNSGNDDMLPVTKTKATLVVGTVSSSTTGFCVTPGVPTLTLTGSAGGDVQWQTSSSAGFGTSTNVGTNSTTYTPSSNVNATTYYRAIVSCGSSLTSNVVTVTYSNPVITSAPAKTRCGVGTVTLTATANTGSTVNWYNAPTGGSVRATGNSFTTLSLTADTTYYVSAVAGGVSGVLGATSPAVGAFGTSFTGSYEIFDVVGSATIGAVDIYAISAGTVVIELRNSAGTLLQTASTYNVTAGQANSTASVIGTPVTIPVGFTIPAGTGYRLNLGSASTATMIRNSGGASATYGPVSGITITGNSNATVGYYYNFYNWAVTSGCESNRTPVNITVQTPPALALDASSVTICQGGSGTTVNVTAGTKPNYTIFKWSPTTGATPGSSPNGTSVLLNPSTNTTYTLAATGGGPNGLCAATATVSVAVVPKPANPVIANVSLCTGVASAPLTISNAVATVTGSGTSPIAFTNTVNTDEGSTFAAGITMGTITLPALPVGTVITKAGFTIANMTPVAANAFASYVRLGLKTTGGANVTTTGYQGSTANTTAVFTYQTTVANEPTIAAALPLSGGTFNIIYYSTTNNDATKQDVNFPATGTFYYEYTVPVTYNWYTSQYGASPITTGTTWNPVGVAGSGIANTTTVASATYWVSGVSSALCNTARTAVTYAVKARPTPTFTVAPTSVSCVGTNVTYTTQAGMTSYIWTVPGVLNTDYQIVAGGVGTASNTVTLKWLIAGSKTVTINYNNAAGCSATSAVSSITTAAVAGAASVAIAGSSTACYGGAVTYTATPTNGGSAPSYQWKKDASNVGTNSPTYVDAGTTGGVITCVMTSNFGCLSGSPTVTSNAITLAITPNAWTGAVSADFSNAGNWCAGVVPTSAANISIPSSATNMPKLTNYVTVNNLTLNTGGTLDLNGYRLTINGTISGAGYIKGSTTSLLSFAGSGALGTLNMDPTAKSLKVLQFNGAGTLTLGNSLDIYDSVDVDASTLTTGGFLTLKSNQSGTARLGMITTGGVSGNVTVERWLKNVSRRTFRLLSVPTQGAQTIKQAWMENQAPLANGNPGYGTLLTSTFGVAQGYDATTVDNSMLVWNPATAMFDYVGPTSSPIATTGGYYVYIRGDRSVLPTGSTTTTTTLRSTGGLYQGTQSVVNATGGQNTVVGNVYASAIDFLNLQNTGITAFKVWDPNQAASSTTAGAGAYVTFSAANSWQPVPFGGSYGTAANTRIESGQAFIVSPTSAGTITFTEAAKATGSRSLVRGANTLQRMKTNLYAVNGTQSTLADGNVAVFDNSYSAGLDDYDVLKMNNSSENFGISNSGRQLVIDARPEVVESDVINYAMTNMKAQRYSVEFITENMDPMLTAYLEDSYLNSRTPITLNSTVTVAFSVTSDAASAAANRFRVVFKNNSTLPVTFTTVKANERNRKVTVEWVVAGEKNIRSYGIEHSTDGRTFRNVGSVAATSNGSVRAEYSWLHESPAGGGNYYRIRSESPDGEQKYSSIVKVTIGEVKGSYVVAPNPVTDGNVTVQFVNQPEGSYAIRLLNSVGQVMYSKTVNHTGGNSSNRLGLSTSLAGGLYKIEILQPDKSRYVQNLVISNGK